MRIRSAILAFSWVALIQASISHALPPGIEKTWLISDDLARYREQTQPTWAPYPEGFAADLPNASTFKEPRQMTSRLIPVQEYGMRFFDPVIHESGTTIRLPADAQATLVQPDWAGIFQAPKLSSIKFGVHINEVSGTWPDAWSLNEKVSFKPASNAKLFSALLALTELGTQFRFRTEITAEWVGKKSDGVVRKLTLHASGDPSWGLWDSAAVGTFPELTSLAASLRYLGVKKVLGPVSVQAKDSRLNDLRIPSGWSFGDTIACYGTAYQAVNLQANCATYQVTGNTTGKWLETGVPIPVKVVATTGTVTDLVLTAKMDAREQPISYTISGTLIAGATPNFVLPIPNATQWAINVLTTKLTQQGVVFEKENTTLPSSGLTLTHSYASRTLGQILVPFMKLSINLVGDGFFRYLGSLKSPAEPNLWKAGADLMEVTLRNAGISDFYLEDGSGISHDNRVQPLTLLSTLIALRERADFPTLWSSLPIAGRDGTLASRMKGTQAEGYLRAKTGTLTGTYNLSGYVPETDLSGKVLRYIPFVMINQTTGAFGTQARQTANEACISLSNFVRAVP
ncbi:MAG: D-alanyl-D-alanine carboxypeptidase/D-alanyl-D-alanine-endopeptidase [Bdellovibrionales bacterium]|nr:D-alanyl-D-alanine carboxypeptidase/D-alanyl-D-alanine-endopeptidase [Bdellovibrionales bacterium]